MTQRWIKPLYGGGRRGEPDLFSRRRAHEEAEEVAQAGIGRGGQSNRGAVALDARLDAYLVERKARRRGLQAQEARVDPQYISELAGVRSP